VIFNVPLSTNIYFSLCFTCPASTKFGGHVPNSSIYKKMKFLSPYCMKKMHLWAFQPWLYPSGTYEKHYFFISNVIISQTVYIGCLQICRHVDIQVRYKILQLDVRITSSQSLNTFIFY
jgi:hypothetical protein